MASAMPVLPLVASTSVSPGLISPRASACLIMESAGRSLTDPAGLLPSSLARMVFEVFPGRRCNFTSGVLPTNSSRVFINNAAAKFGGSYGTQAQLYTLRFQLLTVFHGLKMFDHQLYRALAQIFVDVQLVDGAYSGMCRRPVVVYRVKGDGIQGLGVLNGAQQHFKMLLADDTLADDVERAIEHRGRETLPPRTRLAQGFRQ